MKQDKTNSIDDLTKQNIAQALWLKEYKEKSIPRDILEKIKSEKNSNRSFAARFNKYLQQLTNNKMSFVTSREDRYKVIMNCADTRSPQQCYSSILFLGPESVTGYEPIPNNPQFDFPQIDSPQWKNQVGWHFFVGNFIDTQGRHYSVQYMFWQYALMPPPVACSLGLSDIENQMLEMHLAISDPQTGTHYRANTVVVAGTTGLINFIAKPYSYTLGNNSINSLDGREDLFPVRLRARGWDMGKTPDAEIEIDLSLKSDSGYFMEGVNGCLPSIDGVGTLYYSAANMKLEDKRDNVIIINGNKIKLTTGSMWYDHQWGTGFMPNGAPNHTVMRAAQNITKPAPGGWDWFMVQFYQNDRISKNGEVQMAISSLHTNKNEKYYWQTGPTPPGVMTESFNGKYIYDKNITRDITGVMTVSKWVKSTTSPNPGVYPPTNTWYPATFEFTVDGNVPDPIKQFTLIPIIESGQTGFFATGLQYSEGGAVIKNSEGKEIGRGFAESTNYARLKEGIISLSGLPVNAQTLSFLTAPKVSWLLKIMSFTYVAIHRKELKKIVSESKGLNSIS